MSRTELFLDIDNPEEFKNRILFASSHFFDTVCILDSNNHSLPDQNGKYNFLAAIGVGRKYVLNDEDPLAFLEKLNQKTEWLFGGFSYEFKNTWWKLNSLKLAGNWPSVFFFEPQILVQVTRENPFKAIITLSDEDISVWENMLEFTPDVKAIPFTKMGNTICKEDYLQNVLEIKEDIKNGEYYELNYCIELKVEQSDIHPPSVYKKLKSVSPNPFSVFMKWEKNYAMSASPERFMKKNGQKLLSQPMKGTSRRFEDKVMDEKSRHNLENSVKDRAENVMIVDLVRNDLSRNCIAGTVKVEELFKVYSFPQVHQMISTVSGQLRDGTSGLKALADAFPMGSMTGAPKIKVMEKIEALEPTCRGLYSGCLGYIDPKGDFDFNVMIRTLFYNTNSKMLQYFAGGAITSDSAPEEEFDEVMLKAELLKKVFSGV